MNPRTPQNSRNSENRRRLIVGIGEAIRIDGPIRSDAGGLACDVALASVRLGHTGVAISRIGQDSAGDELLKSLRDAGVNVDHLQTDPDLPTGRMSVRSIAGRTSRTLTPQAAFDNLQWDFDLVDVGQDADAVVFGELARRGGQTKSVIKQFLASCGSALKFYDATNRSDEAGLDRANVRTALELADGVVADAAALRALVPSWNNEKVDDGARALLVDSRLAVVLTIERGGADEVLSSHSRDASCTSAHAYPSAQRALAMVGVLHGLIEGWEMQECIDRAAQAAARSGNTGGDEVEPLLRGGK